MADELDLERALSGETDLTSCDFREADLTGFDFRGRDLTNVQLVKAVVEHANFSGCDLRSTQMSFINASGANFSEAQMPQHLGYWNLTKANLSGLDLSDRMIQVCKFIEADIRHTNFSKSRLVETNDFTDAIIDNQTLFENIEALRLHSRFDAFRNYDYARGVFTRKTNSSTFAGSARDDGSESSIDSKRPDSFRDMLRIQNKVSASAVDIQHLSLNLALALKDHINRIHASKPNDPEELEKFDNYVTLLEGVAGNLWDIGSELNRVDPGNAGPENSVAIEKASSLVYLANQSIKVWFKASSGKIVGDFYNAGMIGACSALFALCGAPPSYAFGTAVAVIGGRSLAEASALFTQKSPDKKK